MMLSNRRYRPALDGDRNLTANTLDPQVRILNGEQMGLIQTNIANLWPILYTRIMADPTTITMNISLPELLKKYVDGKVSSGYYGSASEFVREAIREKFLREQEREHAKAGVASKLVEGLDSGTPIPFTDSYATDKKRALRSSINSRRSKP